jgi:hypothetical protein
VERAEHEAEEAERNGHVMLWRLLRMKLRKRRERAVPARLDPVVRVSRLSDEVLSN